jgi:hypothetical protein
MRPLSKDPLVAFEDLSASLRMVVEFFVDTAGWGDSEGTVVAGVLE